MTAAVAAKRYDARCSAALRRLAAASDVRWSRVAALEDSLALHLKSILRSRRGAEGGVAEGGGAEGGGAEGGAEVATSSAMSPSAAKPQPTGGGQTGASDDAGWLSQLRNTASRALSVTAAAAVGGSVLFITGGLAAPAVVASLASMGAAGGILGTAALSVGTLLAYFGGAGGISMIFGGVGAGLTGWRMLNRTSGLAQFAFLPVRGTGAGMSVYLFVPGFLRDPADLFRTWGATDGVYSVVLRLPSRGSDKDKDKDNDRDNDKDKLDEDDDVKGQLVAGLGMWLKRDPITDDVFVSWIDPGGAADRAGVAEGSVLTALATRVERRRHRTMRMTNAARTLGRLQGCDRSAGAGTIRTTGRCSGCRRCAPCSRDGIARGRARGYPKFHPWKPPGRLGTSSSPSCGSDATSPRGTTWRRSRSVGVCPS